MNKNFGWDFAPEDTSRNYRAACLKFVNDELEFSNFRRNPEYTTILEGGEDIIGHIHIGHIQQTNTLDPVLKNITKYKEADIYGNPVVRNYPIVGDICPNTLHYIDCSLSIQRMVGDKQIKHIVEIGGGFGNLCKTISCDIDFETYTLVDLPEAILLCKKYLANFPNVYKKVKFVSCDELDTAELPSNIDLFIADSSLAECGKSTQEKYINQFLLKSKFGYIVYNSLHIAESRYCYSYLLEACSNYSITIEDVGGNKVLYLVYTK